MIRARGKDKETMMFSAIISSTRFGRFTSSVLVVFCGLAPTSIAQDMKPTSPATTQPTGQLSEEQKIEGLIKAVHELQDAVFIRNDKEYEGKAAADHLRMKWEYAGERIKTARQFITLIATKSSMSGKPYLIRFKDGRETASEAFLGAELEKLEATTSRPADGPTSRPAVRENNPNPEAEGFNHEASDARAIEIADTVMEKMGGRKAWDATRYLTWRFFGRRFHVWDTHTGNIRIEATNRDGSAYVILMNINTKEGRAWSGGEEVTEKEALEGMLTNGLRAWINDSYWMFMPYKLKDSGVTLTYLGEREMEDGRPAEVLQLTFEEVGVTPQNKYHVYVAKESGLVEQWDFFRNASDEEPGFQVPWRNWKKYGDILLSDDRGERRGDPIKHTDLAVFDALPRAVFESPEPVDLKQPLRDGKEDFLERAAGKWRLDLDEMMRLERFKKLLEDPEYRFAIDYAKSFVYEFARDGAMRVLPLDDARPVAWTARKIGDNRFFVTWTIAEGDEQTMEIQFLEAERFESAMTIGGREESFPVLFSRLAQDNGQPDPWKILTGDWTLDLDMLKQMDWIQRLPPDARDRKIKSATEMFDGVSFSREMFKEDSLNLRALGGNRYAMESLGELEGLIEIIDENRIIISAGYGREYPMKRIENQR